MTTETSKTNIKPNKSRKRKNNLNSRYKLGKKKNVEIGGEFTLIRDVVPPKKMKVERVLPHWLLHPIPIRRNLKELKSPKKACPILKSELVKKLKENNINQLFPVQQIVIPQVLIGVSGMENRFRPRDICVATPTGSGKTLAFVLPIVQALSIKLIPAIRAVVILPVIELAKQVFKVFCTYASPFKLRVGQAFGLEHFSSEQKDLVKRVYGHYQSKVDILIATPGRLIDHIMKTPGLDFTQVRFLVLDEADKLLAGDGGELVNRIQNFLMQFKHQEINLGLPPFFPLETRVQKDFFSRHLEEKNENNLSAEEIEEESYGFFSQSFERKMKLDEMEEQRREFLPVPSSPLQRLLFSATLSHNPEQLQNVALYRPILFTSDSADSEREVVEKSIGEPMRPSELTEEWIKVDPSLKPVVLHYLLRKERKKIGNFKALVFANSIELTSKITILLKTLSKNKYSVEEFSSKFKKIRKVKITQFLKGNINVLVSSDAMARGIDVPDIDCVISYDVPSANTYIHRIGRTARAGKPGKAISLVTKDEFKDLKNILGKNFENASVRKIKEEKLQKFESSFKSALETLSEAMKSSRGKKGTKITKTLKRKKVFTKKLKESK